MKRSCEFRNLHSGFLGLLILVAWLIVSSEVRAATPPNIVYILADDQSFQDFGFMGNDKVLTPHIDALAEMSARFPNGYVPMSVCRPSLATFLTGLYPHQHGIHFNHPPPGLSEMRKMSADDYHQTRAVAEQLIRDVPTLPRILGRHGYVSFQAGKHWEGDFRNAGFTDGMTTARPADRLGSITGTREQANGEWVAHGNGDAGLEIGRVTMEPVKDFIVENRQRPFFLWYAPFLPHTPFDAPQEYRDRYAGQDIEPHMLPYYAEIARFDDTVGELLKVLDENDLRRNTLVVFAVDNGFRPHKTRKETYNSRSKLSVHEDGLRTPILLSWPGMIEPANHEQIVQTIDLMPTALAAVGLEEEITPRMPGYNLLPAAKGLQDLPDRAAFGAIYPNDAEVLGDASRHARGVWIRDGHFKLILPGPGPKPLQAALYDLLEDPEEEQNLFGEAAFRQQQAQLTAQLKSWWPATLPNTSSK